MRVRVSYGSAIGLGLLDKKTYKVPETVYILLKGDCTGQCKFCAQAHGESENLSRVVWPEFELEDVVSRIKGQKRVCVQCPNYPGMFEGLNMVLDAMPKVSVSVSVPPLSAGQLNILNGKVDRVGISIDAATEELFKRLKPGYDWESSWAALGAAVEILGKRVSTHLIVGLGESEEEMALAIAKAVGMGVTPSLFAFTPVRGTALEGRGKPDIGAYRRIQIARELLVGGGGIEDIEFKDGKIVGFRVDVSEIASSPLTYVVRGCPDCDRPYYNESPQGPFFNWPRKPNKEEMDRIVEEFKLEKHIGEII